MSSPAVAPNGGHRWTQEDNELLVSLTRAGHDAPYIAAALGRTESAVHTRAFAMLPEPTQRRLTRGATGAIRRGIEPSYVARVFLSAHHRALPELRDMLNRDATYDWSAALPEPPEDTQHAVHLGLLDALHDAWDTPGTFNIDAVTTRHHATIEQALRALVATGCVATIEEAAVLTHATGTSAERLGWLITHAPTPDPAARTIPTLRDPDLPPPVWSEPLDRELVAALRNHTGIVGAALVCDTSIHHAEQRARHLLEGMRRIANMQSASALAEAFATDHWYTAQLRRNATHAGLREPYITNTCLAVIDELAPAPGQAQPGLIRAISKRSKTQQHHVATILATLGYADTKKHAHALYDAPEPGE